MTNELAKRIGRIKKQYALCSVTSIILGLWTLIAPETFWGVIGIGGDDVIVQAIYGAAICGEGALCALGLRQPLRYLPILQYMMVYKAVVVVGLVPRLIAMESAPLAGWFIIAAWAIAGVQAAVVFPWGRWKEITEALREEATERG